MNRRMLFKMGMTVVVGVGIILFYLVHVQELEKADKTKLLHAGVDDTRVLFYHKVQDTKFIRSGEESLGFKKENTQHLKSDSNSKDDLNKNLEKKSESSGFQQEVNGSKSFTPTQKPVDSSSNTKDEMPASSLKTGGLIPAIESSHQINSPAIHLCVVVCGERGEETIVMLKSAAMVTPFANRLVFHIVAEADLHQYFKLQLELWPSVYRQKVAYKIYPVTFPGGFTSDSWKKLFKPCASQRLFLPDLLQSVDSLIYVDTDVLFLRSLADLWSYFSLFNQSQLAGLVGEAEDGTIGWYNRFANHPYYGQFGVNSGVMLMNLTRLRQSSWLSDMQAFYEQYRLMIPWGDQDLINIYFSGHPDQLYLLPCHWNYRGDHCKYMSTCKHAEREGVAVLHGSRRMFFEDKEPTFAAVFRTFKKYYLGDDLEFHFLQVLKENFQSVQGSNCIKVSQIFLMQLQKLLDRDKDNLHIQQPNGDKRDAAPKAEQDNTLPGQDVHDHQSSASGKKQQNKSGHVIHQEVPSDHQHIADPHKFSVETNSQTKNNLNVQKHFGASREHKKEIYMHVKMDKSIKDEYSQYDDVEDDR